jgi:pyrroline-5-carboxylate reductase
MAKYQLGAIGAGNMAEALLRGAISANVIDHKNVVVSDPKLERRQLFTSELGVKSVQDNTIPAACPHLLLSVKPQAMAQVLAGIADAVDPEAVIISIAAGIRTEFIFEKLKRRGRLVRVMPNTPMLVAAGASALCKGPGASDADLTWAEKLFAACGKTVRVEEPMIDAVTAVSGSGPAYFFYLIEAMTAAGVAEGIDPEVAEMLATRTCIGAGQLLAETRTSPEALRKQVTTPGGTTQRAFETMEAANVKETLVQAIRAAAERSRELGR